jgi:23S rRNA pseudoU1915 N3-methylase RlmH
MYGGMGGYAGRNKQEAEQLGWKVIDYILDVEVPKVPPFKKEFEDDRVDAVTFFPSGIGTGTTANNQTNLTGVKGYNKWKKWMSGVAQTVGMELIKFKRQKEEEKEQKKSVSKDSKETLKQQKKDEKEVQKNVKTESFTKKWWKKELTEKLVTKTQLKPRGKELLLMGGAYGHMAHPFDDKDLTFGDLKKIITDGLGGHLNREDGVTEKLDGQNIMISWKDGKLIAARNKGHIKNGGKTALDAKGMASKFKGRGQIAAAFNFAMKDLGRAIGSLSEKQKTKIFNNGYNFMNLEVMWPKSANVIDYDVAHLVFHGALKYDDSGKVIGEVPGSARMLAGMIKQVNMHIGKKYSISKPVFLTIPKHQDFSAKKDKFIGKLNKLRNTYGLKDNDTLALYHQSYWEEYIYNAAQQFGYTIPDDILKNLTKRWAFFDKSYKVPTIRKDLKDEPDFLSWVLKTDKENHSKMVKENMKPFETLFFEVGAEILKNVQGFMAANPDKAVQGIRKKLSSAISNVKAGGDKKKLNTLKLQLDKLNKIGGVDAIVPSEGIVFKYKGKTYKFTGAFAPINQITGLINF